MPCRVASREMGSCFKYSPGRVSQLGTGVAQAVWFEPQSPECNEATVINEGQGSPGRVGEVEEGAGGRPRASHISSDTDLGLDADRLDCKPDSQGRRWRRRGARDDPRAMLEWQLAGGWFLVSGLAWPAATGELARECVVPGLCLTAEGPSGYFKDIADPERCSELDHVAMGKKRKRDVLRLWIMIGSQRACPKPSKHRPMCAYVATPRLGLRYVSECACEVVAWPLFSSSPSASTLDPRPSQPRPRPVVTVVVTAAVMVAGAVELQA